MERTGGKGGKTRGERGKEGAGVGRGKRKGRDEGKGKGGGRGSSCPSPHDMFGPRPCHYIVSIAAAEKRPLSYQTPQSVHMVRNSGAQTLPLTMHYGVKWGKIGKEWSDLDPQRTRSYFLGSSLRCKVSSKLNCDREWGDRQTDRHTDAGEFIICHMLCYINGTDNNVRVCHEGPGLALIEPWPRFIHCQQNSDGWTGLVSAGRRCSRSMDFDN